MPPKLGRAALVGAGALCFGVAAFLHAGEPREGQLPELTFPLQGVPRSAMKNTFNDRRGRRIHHAVDIMAPRNSPVVAVAGGVVAKLTHRGAGGIAIYQFDSSGRYCFFYAHLQKYAEGLKEGQALVGGETIGYVGSSGNAPRASPHLHLAIAEITRAGQWWGGTPIDPFPILR